MSDAAEDMDLGGEAPAEGGLPPEGKTPDVFADVPADGGLPEAEPAPEGGGLGGDGGTLEDLEEPAVEEAPINGEEPVPAAADPLAEEEPAPVPAEEPPAEPDPAPEPEPESEPTPAPETAKAEPKKGGGKKGTTERVYHILQKTEEGAFVIPEAVKEGIKATNGEGAMRAAYSALVDEDSDQPLTLVVIPSHYWKPKTVQSKVKRDRAIEIV